MAEKGGLAQGGRVSLPEAVHDNQQRPVRGFLHQPSQLVELRSGGTEVKTGGVRFEGTEGWIWVARDGWDAAGSTG